MPAAIAYEDYMQHGTWSSGFGSSVMDLSPLDKACTPQLGFPWAAQAQPGGPRIIVREFPYVSTPIDIVALLDVRSSSTLQVGVQHGPGTTLFPINALTTYPSTDFVRHVYFMLPARVLTNALLFQFLAPTGSTYSIGRIWAGPLWTPPSGIKRNWRPLVLDGDSSEDRSDGGQVYTRPDQVYRGLYCELSHTPLAQVIGLPDHTVMDLQQLAFRLGTKRPCIVIPKLRQPSGDWDLHAIHRLAVYGGIQPPGIDIRHTGGDYFDASLTVKEWL